MPSQRSFNRAEAFWRGRFQRPTRVKMEILASAMLPTLAKLTKEEKAAERDEADSLITQRGMGKKAFAHVNKPDFILQLRSRVRQPKLINQGHLGFCAPAAILYAMAKDSPLEYATFALDLFFRGKATVRGWQVDVSHLLDQNVPASLDPAATSIGACDWVTMAGVRTNVGFGAALTSVNINVEGALPFEIVSCFKSLGYQNVLNETYSTILWKADENNLRQASKLWGQGYRVVFCVNANMFHNATAQSLKPNHFCTLKSAVRIATSVTCRVWQWGINDKEPTTAGSSIYVDLPKDQFMAAYFGFVAAGDRRLG